MSLDKKYIFSSLSHATMREEDLIPDFLNFVLNHKDEKAWQETNTIEEKAEELKREIYCMQIELNDGKSVSYELLEEWRSMWYFEDRELASQLTIELFDLIDSIAPEGTYFGAHPGDLSEYGFWPFEDSDLWE